MITRNMKKQFGEKQVAVSGTVAYIQMHITGEDSDSRLFEWYEESREEHEQEIRRVVSEILGGGFEVFKVSAQRGSLDIHVILKTVGEIYLGISQSNDFCASLGKITSRLKQLFQVQLKLSLGRTSVSATWLPQGTMATVPYTARHSKLSMNRVISLYLVASHAVLLLVLIWLLVRHG